MKKQRGKETKQENNKNWQLLFNTQFQNLQGKNAISNLWINGFSKLGVDNSVAPDVTQLNLVSTRFTKWKFIQTNEIVIIEPSHWYEMIAKKIMPLNYFIRKPEELSYCDEPDKWHDIIGHIPFLMMDEYSDMYVKLANLYLKNIETQNEIVKNGVDFIGAYGIELGLINENGKIKALGSTLYSSSGELEEAYKKENQKNFDEKAVWENKKYNRHAYQGVYYIFESLNQIIKYLDKLENLLN